GAAEGDAGRAEAERGVPHQLRPLQPQRAGRLSRIAHRRAARPAEADHPQSLRSVHDVVHPGQAPARAGHHDASMTAYATALLDRLPTAIAVITPHGGIEYRNAAFEATFGGDAKSWLKDATRAVAGERGWLQSFFVAGDDDIRSTDVEIEGRIYRVDRIMHIG